MEPNKLELELFGLATAAAKVDSMLLLLRLDREETFCDCCWSTLLCAALNDERDESKRAGFDVTLLLLLLATEAFAKS